MSELEIPPTLAHLGWTGLAAWGVQKVFSGSIEAVNDELGVYTRAKFRNALGVFERIGQRTAHEDPNEDHGSVPERLALQIADQASLISDGVMQDYLAGIAVSSRTHDDWDDRGVTLCNTISRLSALQVRTHYLMYRLFQRVVPEGVDLSATTARASFYLRVPAERYVRALHLEADRFDELATHSIIGLEREQLLDAIRVGDMNTAIEYFPQWAGTSGDVVISTLTPLGVELYLWANGVQSSDTNALRTCPVVSDLSAFVDVGVEPVDFGAPAGMPTADQLREEARRAGHEAGMMSGLIFGP